MLPQPANRTTLRRKECRVSNAMDSKSGGKIVAFAQRLRSSQKEKKIEKKHTDVSAKVSEASVKDTFSEKRVAYMEAKAKYMQAKVEYKEDSKKKSASHNFSTNWWGRRPWKRFSYSRPQQSNEWTAADEYAACIAFDGAN